MDNLSTVDKFAGPNVSFIKRSHCSISVINYLFQMCFALSCSVDDDDGFFPRQSRSGHHSTDGRVGSSRSPFGFPDPFSGFGGGFGDGFGGPGFSSFQTFSTSGGKSPEGTQRAPSSLY